MKISLEFKELSALVGEMTGWDTGFRYCGNERLEVTVNRTFVCLTVRPRLDITIESVQDSYVILRYGGNGIIVSLFSFFLKRKLRDGGCANGGLITMLNGRRLGVNLLLSERMKSFFEKFSLKSIVLSERGAEIDCELRNH